MFCFCFFLKWQVVLLVKQDGSLLKPGGGGLHGTEDFSISEYGRGFTDVRVEEVLLILV